jgi:Ulp1 family protease
VQIINFYMKLLIGRSKANPKLPKIWAQNTFFYQKLSNPAEGFDKVKRWTRKACYNECPL